MKEEYPEQEFIASCLRVGLTTEDLKELTYIEAMKVLYSFINEDKRNNNTKANQADINELLM